MKTQAKKKHLSPPPPPPQIAFSKQKTPKQSHISPFPKFQNYFWFPYLYHQFLGGSKGAPYLFSGEVVIPKGL